MKQPHYLKPHSMRLGFGDPTRPARALRYVLIEAGTQGVPPRYAMDAVCDDGEVRTFVVGGRRQG